MSENATAEPLKFAYWVPNVSGGWSPARLTSAPTRDSTTKARATDVALEVTSRIFEVTGARSTTAALGLDRHWGNVRTHTLHDPVADKRREVGAFLLRDEIPEPTWYS